MTKQHILQVSELTKKVKFMLESELNTVWLCGEISNFVSASSGHWYLSLKDNKSQVKCAMFKGKNSRVRLNTSQHTPKNGQQVLVRAKVSLYEPRGDFQVIIELMEDAGDGLLRQQFEQLKGKLNAQGLFSNQYKQVMPKTVANVGIVTSPTGAAIKDILTVLKRRNPSISVTIYPSLVQGNQAKFDLVNAIETANNHNICDVLIVGRGGGSLEDLWPFNEETVIEAIFHSRIPIISAIGHEVDTTLADFVADHRAPTPSAAAEIVSLDTSVTMNKFSLLTGRLKQALLQKVATRQQKLHTLQHRLMQEHPEQSLQRYQQKSDELTTRLSHAHHREITRFNVKPCELNNRLVRLSPKNKISQKKLLQQQFTQRLTQSMTTIINQKEILFWNIIEQLQLVSPLATIARGYAIARNEHGIIKSTSQVSTEEAITIQLSDGLLKANITEIDTKKT